MKDNILAGEMFAHGKYVSGLYQGFDVRVRSPHRVRMSDGTLTLRARNEPGLVMVKQGKGITVPADKCLASALAIKESRLPPVMAEPNQTRSALSPARFERASPYVVKATAMDGNSRS